MDFNKSRPLARFALLALLMAATRYHHFGSSLQLPDASTAVFFIAGLYVASASALPALLLLAGLLDYLAVAVGGVSAWCVTPAYAFLIPTYAVLWFGGRWYASRHRLTSSTAVPLAGALLVTTALAFLISNVGFYAFSGYFPEMSAAEYSDAVAPYYSRYLGWTVFYVVVVVAIQMTAARLASARRADTR